jgi:hypothetical protein
MSFYPTTARNIKQKMRSFWVQLRLYWIAEKPPDRLHRDDMPNRAVCDYSLLDTGGAHQRQYQYTKRTSEMKYHGEIVSYWVQNRQRKCAPLERRKRHKH